jgi:enoyl-CoA hydratase/carnithine racemase
MTSRDKTASAMGKRACVRNVISAIVGLMIAAGLANPARAANLDTAAKGYKYLRCERHGAVYIARFYNPPTNLLNGAMVDEIRDLLKQVESDKQTRVLVFTGGLPNYFIQHFDVAEIKKLADAVEVEPTIASESELKPIHQAFLEIEALSKPVIAAINGEAQGGGLEFALSCDFRIITDTGVLGFPEVTGGFVPGAGGTVRLPRLIGIPHAKEMIMFGQPVDARTAERWGLVSKAVPPDQLMPETLKWAQGLASLPPAAVSAAKKLMNATGEMPMQDALKLEQATFWGLLNTDDARRIIDYVVTNGEKKAAPEKNP